MSIVRRAVTREELARCNGRDGSPAFIAYRGLVYDVSGSFQWRMGKHQVVHPAGCDLTESLREAPHGEDLLLRFPIIGSLVEDVVAVPLGSADSAGAEVQPAGGRNPHAAG